MEPAAGQAGKEVHQPGAMTPLVGARFTRVIHRGWSRSTTRPLRLCFDTPLRTGHDRHSFDFCCFFCSVSSFSLLTAYYSWDTHSLAQENKRASTINILHGSGAWCKCPGLSGYHGEKGGARCYCWDAAIGKASNGGKTYFALAACGERSGDFARQDQRQGCERRFIVKQGIGSFRFLMCVWTSTTTGASKSLQFLRWKTTLSNCWSGPRN